MWQAGRDAAVGLRRGLAPCEALGGRLPLRWRAGVFAGGVLLVAVGVVLLMHAGLGAGPGDVLVGGVSARTGWSHGSSGVLVGAVLAVVATSLGARPKAGTVVLALSVGPLVNMLWDVAPSPTHPFAQWVQLAAGVVAMCVGVAAVLHAAFGPGNLELISGAFAERASRPLPLVRSMLELSLTGVGAAAGGMVGPGTLVVAFTIGPGVMLALTLSGRWLVRFAAPTSAAPHRPVLWRMSRL